MATTRILAVSSLIGEQSSPRTIAAGATESVYCDGPAGTLMVYAGARAQGSFVTGVQLVGPLTYYIQRCGGVCGCTVES